MKAVRNREEFLGQAKYNFYVDNIDIEDAPSIPKYVLNSITNMIGVQFLDLEPYLEINNLFKRTMNEILFNNALLNDPSLKI